jgi:hypothetical protein
MERYDGSIADGYESDFGESEVDACDVCEYHISECVCEHYGSEEWARGEAPE